MFYPLRILFDCRTVALDVPFGTPALAAASGATYGNIGTAIIRINDFAHRDAHAARRVGDGGKYLAFACIGKRVQAGKRTGVVKVGVHVRVEDDFGDGGTGSREWNGGGAGTRRPTIGQNADEQATEYCYGSHDGCIVAFRRL